jgi:hypothetical protein
MIPAEIQCKNGLISFPGGLEEGLKVVRRIGDWNIQDFNIKGLESSDQRGMNKGENEAIGL